jgi:chromate reductase
MPSDLNIAVLVGSLRKASYSRRLAEALLGLAPDAMAGSVVEIGDLPLYNQDQDDEGAPPLAWTDFRDTVKARDAVLFVTPEYNRSVPGGSRTLWTWDPGPTARASGAAGRRPW